MNRAEPAASLAPVFDVARIRADFPILARQVHGRPLVYLDSAASAQKPRAVIERMTEVYENSYANVHRGVHRLSQEATDLFEAARDKVAAFVNAKSSDDIVFTRGATEAINLVAASHGQAAFEEGDEIILSEIEHHANIVPWQLLRERLGIRLRVAPVDDDGALRFDAFAGLLGPRTKLVAITHMSNALGSILPVADIIDLAHERGVPVLLDGCQAITHLAVDVQALDVDFYVFSGHKLYGPTGIGALYAKSERLAAMPPYQGGGEMILSVSFDETTFQVPPHRFEAGTPPIVEAIGFGAALDYIDSIGLDAIRAHERDLLGYATARLSALNSLRLIGTAAEKASILSFVMEGAHPHDIGTIADRAGVAIRTGHHCAQPTMARFGVSATARASFAMYNTRDEIDALADALGDVQEIFG